jgi:hypothetical protein
MPKPKTRAELLAQANQERDALLALLVTLSPEELTASVDGGWSAKDLVAHLIEWESLFFGWYEAGLRGEVPALPARGYTWAKMDQLNESLYRRHRKDRLDTVMSDWGDSSLRMIGLIDKTSEADLFKPGRHAWTGKGTLAGYAYECGPNHYRWAGREIKRGLREIKRAVKSKR